MKLKKHLIKLSVFFLLTLLFLKASAQKTTIFATNYDKKKDLTVQVILPYGNISIPGKWTKTSFNQVSKQHFFTNADSITLSVSKNPIDKYPFFKPGLSGQQLVSEFVKWDSEYWEQQGLKIKVLKDESENGFIAWQATINKEYDVNTIFVYGYKNGFAYGFSVSSKLWPEEKMQEFLIQLFKNNS